MSTEQALPLVLNKLHESRLRIQEFDVLVHAGSYRREHQPSFTSHILRLSRTIDRFKDILDWFDMILRLFEKVLAYQLTRNIWDGHVMRVLTFGNLWMAIGVVDGACLTAPLLPRITLRLITCTIARIFWHKKILVDKFYFNCWKFEARILFHCSTGLMMVIIIVPSPTTTIPRTPSLHAFCDILMMIKTSGGVLEWSLRMLMRLLHFIYLVHFGIAAMPIAISFLVLF